MVGQTKITLHKSGVVTHQGWQVSHANS